MSTSDSLPALSARSFRATTSSVTWYSPVPVGSTRARSVRTSHNVTVSNQSTSKPCSASGVAARSSAYRSSDVGYGGPASRNVSK